MADGYRSDLAAAQVRIGELEAKLSAREASPDLRIVEEEHAKLVRAVPVRWRVWFVTGIAAIISAITLPFMLLPTSPYEHNPRFTLACQLVAVFSMWVSALMQWMGRFGALEKVKLSERLLASERARAALEERVRVADPTRVGTTEALDETEELATSQRGARS